MQIGSQKLRLAHGYDVFISRLDLWEAEKASKKGWTILIRRLLDIYFDRMTLAMGKPTHHGNSMEYQPLDQNIIGAISGKRRICHELQGLGVTLHYAQSPLPQTMAYLTCTVYLQLI